MRFVRVFFAITAALGSVPATAQQIPPSALKVPPTLPPAPQYRIPVNAVNPFANKTLASPYGPCGDDRIPVRIIGRVQDSMTKGATGFIRIVPGATDTGLMKELRQEVSVEHDLVATIGNTKRMNELERKYTTFTPPPANMSLDEFRQSVAKIKDDNQTTIAQTKASRIIAIENDGSFRCNALPAGWYNFVATILHPEPAGATTRQFGAYTIAKHFFVARAYVPKPVPHRRVIVPVANFQVLGVVDPNAK